jgi:signal transduction histidine kinase
LEFFHDRKPGSEGRRKKGTFARRGKGFPIARADFWKKREQLSDEKIRQEVMELLGSEEGTTRVAEDPKEILEIAKKLFEECKSEALILMGRPPSSSGSDANDLNLLAKKVVEEKVRVRVLAPIPDIGKLTEQFEGVEWRKIERVNVGIAIYDREKMVLIEYSDSDTLSTPENRVRSGIVTTSKQTVAGVSCIFDGLWRESEFRRQSELLQDIITHDLRNYNQILLMGAEVIAKRGEDLQSKDFLSEQEVESLSKDIQFLARSMLKSIEGSTLLLEKAKKLGKILSEQNPELRPVDLVGSIRRSLDLVKSAFPQKQVNEEIKIMYNNDGDDVREKVGENWRSEATTIAVVGAAAPPPLLVLADDLLEEVFTNLISNVVKYTEGGYVPVEISITKKYEKKNSKEEYWKVSISDEGRGIPAELKNKVFLRYLETSKGTGLGMSIVHGLVVERYRGRVNISDRVEGDRSKGTVVEIWLHRALQC